MFLTTTVLPKHGSELHRLDDDGPLRGEMWRELTVVCLTFVQAKAANNQGFNSFCSRRYHSCNQVSAEPAPAVQARGEVDFYDAAMLRIETANDAFCAEASRGQTLEP